MTESAAASTVRALPFFIGRQRELAELTALAAQAERGEGNTVLVAGDAGSGKTQLAHELGLWARQSGFEVCWSAGEPLTGGPTLAPWRYALGRLDPDASTAAAEDLERRRTRWELFSGLLERLRTAIRQPTLLILDDLHRADDDTLAFTRFAAPGLHGATLLTVALWRSGTDALAVRRKALDAVLPTIQLGPLSDADAAQLAVHCTDRELDEATVRTIVDAAAGNPMLVCELVRRPASPSSMSPRAVIADRLRSLPSATADVVAAAALRPGVPDAATVASLTERSVAEVRDAVDASGGIVAERDGAIVFHHDLFQEAAWDVLDPADQRTLHLRAAREFDRDPDGAPLAAEHLRAAALLGHHDPDGLFDAARRAAHQLWSDLAWRRSLVWHERAAQLGDRHDLPDKWRAVLDYGTALQRCGLLANSREVFIRIARADIDDPVLLADAALGVPGMWVVEERDPIARMQMLEWCASAIDRLSDDETTRKAELAVRIAAERTYEGGDLADVRAPLDELRQGDDLAALARGLSLYHNCLLGPDHSVHGPPGAPRRRDVADELISTAIRGEEEFYATLGLAWQVVDLYLDGDPSADRFLVPLARRVETMQIEALGHIVDVIETMRMIRAGRFEQAEIAAGRAVDRGLAAGDIDATAYYVGQVGCIRWLQGRMEEVEPAVRDATDSAALRLNDLVYPSLLAYTCALRGDLLEAESIARGLLSAPDDVPNARRTSTWTTAVAAIAEYAWVAGDQQVAEWAMNAALPYSGSVVMPSLAVACLGPIDRSLGLCALTMGRPDEAVDWFRRAERQNAVIRNRPIGVLIAYQLAAALVATGRSEVAGEAATLAAEAEERAARFGMKLPELPEARNEPHATTPPPGVVDDDEPTRNVRAGQLTRHERHWTVELDGRDVEVPASIGLRYLAVLLANPNHPIEATELSALVTGDGMRARAVSPSTQEVFDEEALTAFRRRLDAIQLDLERADRRGDADASRRLIEERDAILDGIRRGTALGGRSRRLSDDAERARGRVGTAVRRSLRAITERDPVIGHELTTGIRLGYACVYSPDPGRPVSWEIDD